MNANQGPYIIYNLFPTLAGPIHLWQKHLERIYNMGFNWIYVNPLHKPGMSGSLYSIKDYYMYHPLIKNSFTNKKTKEHLKKFIKQANSMGIKVMADLVINHTAIDCPLIKSNPIWYKHDRKGKIVNPCAKKGKIVQTVWGDLAEIDNARSKDKENLWNYWRDLVLDYMDCGFEGFRCDAAYQVPSALWKFLIKESKKKNKDILFFGETLGCSPKQTMAVIKAGFKVIFNSSKYWDFKEPWCMQQYELTRELASSVSFPESHDTKRLAEETNGAWDIVKLKYLFSALFSGGVMIPMGFEFGFRKKLHVVNTTPDDWETQQIDLGFFIQSCNLLKKTYPLFQADYPTDFFPEEAVAVFLKRSEKSNEKALVLINYTDHYREFYNGSLFDSFFQGCSAIQDISPAYPMNNVPNNFHYNLRPYQIKILYAK
ncbi:alpha-amylase [bacterium]|nr:alpha-amylase [bacterium]